MGPKTWVLLSGGATNAFTTKAEKAFKSTGATLASLRGGVPEGIGKGDVVIFLTPSGRGDYNLAKTMAENGMAKAIVIVNGFAKVGKLDCTAFGTAVISVFHLFFCSRIKIVFLERPPWPTI